MKNYFTFLLMFSSLAALSASTDELQERLDALAEEVQLLKSSQLQIAKPAQSYSGLGPAASKVHLLKRGLSIGGYGEILYTDQRNEDESGNNVSARPKAEVLRNVLYIGYKFDNDWTLNTEIELEHVDEVFVEFAYLEKNFSEAFNLRAGLLLIPMGFVNEGHEPTLFPTVKRPYIESQLIPTTWRELGLGLWGKYKNFEYKAYLVNGLDATDFAASSVLRSSRKKGGAGSNTDAGALALVTGVDIQALSWLNLGGSIYFGKASGGSLSSGASIDDLTHSIFELHSEVQYQQWKFRGLFIHNHFSSSGYFNNTTARSLPSDMQGFYLEGQYKISLGKERGSISPFARFEKYNLNKKMPTGYTSDPSKEGQRLSVGVNYQPDERIIFKTDYTMISNEADSGINEFNLGLGYYF